MGLDALDSVEAPEKRWLHQLAESRDKRVLPWRIESEMKRIGANYIQT
jgi:hypothetical protein